MVTPTRFLPQRTAIVVTLQDHHDLTALPGSCNLSPGKHTRLQLRSRLRLRFLPDLPRDIESSVGFPTMDCSVGFPTMNLAFLVGVSHTGIWFFPTLVFCFCSGGAIEPGDTLVRACCSLVSRSIRPHPARSRRAKPQSSKKCGTRDCCHE